jgi:hypothetical protein
MPEASESAYKPSDFLVGVVDFFSVILPGALSLFRRRRGSGISRTPPLIPPYKRCGPMEGRLAQDLPEAQPSILPKSYKVCPSLTNLSRLGLPFAVA